MWLQNEHSETEKEEKKKSVFGFTCIHYEYLNKENLIQLTYK